MKRNNQTHQLTIFDQGLLDENENIDFGTKYFLPFDKRTKGKLKNESNFDNERRCTSKGGETN